MASYASYMTKFYKPDSVAQMEMDNTSDSQLGAQVTKAMRPGLIQNLKQRRLATDQNRAALDADAAARGMGSSTWLADVKNRAKTSEANDISSINTNYQQNLYNALQGRIDNRNARNQTADQFNKAALNQLYQTAMGMASQWAMYDKQNEGHGGGGGRRTNDDPYYYAKADNKGGVQYYATQTGIDKYKGKTYVKDGHVYYNGKRLLPD